LKYTVFDDAQTFKVMTVGMVTIFNELGKAQGSVFKGITKPPLIKAMIVIIFKKTDQFLK
jgi:hypothetical protein